MIFSPLFVPSRDAIDEKTEGATRRITRLWERFFDAVKSAINGSAVGVARVSLTEEATSLLSTEMLAAAVMKAGWYRVSYGVQIVQEVLVSSVTVTIEWTARGVAQSHTFTTVNGNLPTNQGAGQWLCEVDAGTAVSYSVGYTSVGFVLMTYDLVIFLEQLP